MSHWICLESSFNCSLIRGCKSHLTELSRSRYRLLYRNGGRGNTSRRCPSHFTFWIWRPAWWLTSTSMWWIWQGRLSLGQLRPLTWTNLFSTLCSNFDMNTFWTDTINDEERGAGRGGGCLYSRFFCLHFEGKHKLFNNLVNTSDYLSQWIEITFYNQKIRIMIDNQLKIINNWNRKFNF